MAVSFCLSAEKIVSPIAAVEFDSSHSRYWITVSKRGDIAGRMPSKLARQRGICDALFLPSLFHLSYSSPLSRQATRFFYHLTIMYSMSMSIKLFKLARSYLWIGYFELVVVSAYENCERNYSFGESFKLKIKSVEFLIL